MSVSILTNSFINVKEATKQVVIAIGIGTLYFIMCVLNPFNLLTGAASLAAFANIRWANLLRAFVIASPGAALGIAGGAHIFNIYSGKVAIGAYPIIPMIAVIVGLGTYYLGQKIGRSTLKDISLIAGYGLIMGLVSTLHLTSIAVIMDGSAWGELTSFAAQWKIFTHTLIPVLGYPFVRYFETIIKR